MRARSPLFGLEGTVSASLRLNDVYLDTKWLIADNGITFLKKIRPIFLLLQSGLAWGLAEAALTNATSKLGGPRMALKDQAERLKDQFRHLVEEVRSLARMYDSVDASVSYRALKFARSLRNWPCRPFGLSEAAGGAGYLSESARHVGCGRRRFCRFKARVSYSCARNLHKLKRLHRWYRRCGRRRGGNV